jgi:two-component system NarL family sensor kinase
MNYFLHFMNRKLFLLFVIIFPFCSLLNGQYTKIDSLEHLLKTASADSTKMYLNNKIGASYVLDDPRKAFSYLKNAAYLAKQLNNRNEEANALNRLGVMYRMLEIPDSALIYLKLALPIAKQTKNTVLEAKIISNFGDTYNILGDFAKALENNLTGLKLQEQIGNKVAIANSLRNIANTYYYLKQFDLSLKYNKQALDKSVEAGDKIGISHCYNSLGTIYDQQDNYKEALSFYLDAYKINQELGATIGSLKNLMNIGTVYEKLKEFQRALQYQLKALDLARVLNDKGDEANILSNIGNYYARKKEYKSSLRYDLEAYILYKESHSLEKQYNTSYSILKNHIMLGNSEEAIKFLAENDALKDTVFNTGMIEKISEMQTKYETEKKENLLKLSNLELEKQKQTSFYATVVFGVVFFVMILTAFLIYYRYRAKQKIRFETEMRKQEALRYETVIDTLEKERNRIANELHDNTGALLSFIISKTDFILNNEQETKEEIKTIKSSAQEVMTSLRETLWTLNNKSITNYDLIDKLKVYIKKHLLTENKISDNSPNEFVLSNDAVLALYRCVQEIINNINKHSRANHVNVNFSSSESVKFSITIEDNGIGFKEKQKEDSYGLRNLRSRLEKINAELILSSEPDKGTKISIHYV